MSHRILLVDDERGFVQILGERLKFRGYDIRIAFSGEDALEKLEEEAADVVILDVRMPGIDGLEALREIKSTWPLTEVILLTGHAATETAVEGMKNGAFGYLIKPAQIEELIEIIGAALARRAEQEQQNSAPASPSGA